MIVDNTIHNQEASMQNLITVIIATKSRWVDLEKALLSLRNQTVQPDVIVMDDNSDDEFVNEGKSKKGKGKGGRKKK